MDSSKIIFSDVKHSYKMAVVGNLYYFGNNTDDLEREIETGVPHALNSITEKGKFIPENCSKAFSVIYPKEITAEEECENTFNSFYKLWRKKPYTLFSLYDTRDGGYYEGLITMVDPNDYSFKLGDMVYEINELIDEAIELNVLDNDHSDSEVTKCNCPSEDYEEECKERSKIVRLLVIERLFPVITLATGLRKHEMTLNFMEYNECKFEYPLSEDPEKQFRLDDIGHIIGMFQGYGFDVKHLGEDKITISW